MTKIIQNLRKNEYKPMKIAGYNETASVSDQDKPYTIKVKHATGYKSFSRLEPRPDTCANYRHSKGLQFSMLNSRIAIQVFVLPFFVADQRDEKSHHCR